MLKIMKMTALLSSFLFSTNGFAENNSFLSDAPGAEWEVGLRLGSGFGSFDDFEYFDGSGVKQKKSEVDAKSFASYNVYGRYYLPVALNPKITPYVEGGFRVAGMALERDDSPTYIEFNDERVDQGYSSLDLTLALGASYSVNPSVVLSGQLGLSKHLLGLIFLKENDAKYYNSDAFGTNVMVEGVYIINHRAQVGLGLSTEIGSYEYKISDLDSRINGKYSSSYSATALHITGSLYY